MVFACCFVIVLVVFAVERLVARPARAGLFEDQEEPA